MPRVIGGGGAGRMRARSGGEPVEVEHCGGRFRAWRYCGAGNIVRQAAT